MTSTKPSGSPQGETDGFLVALGLDLDHEVLRTALTHRSWSAEHGDAPHNERLEFLGDSVLGLAVTARLFRDFPHLSEGELSKRRAAIVSEPALAGLARDIGIAPVIKLGRGERRSGGRDKDSILADAVEALIGAVFVSNGHEAAEAFVLRVTDQLFDRLDELILFFDPKTTLHEEAQARGMQLPVYEMSSEGPMHGRVFTARVQLGDTVGTGSGSNKKAAEVLAARSVIEQLRAAGQLLTTEHDT